MCRPPPQPTSRTRLPGARPRRSKSTVSTAASARLTISRYDVDRALRRLAPGEQRLDAGTAGDAHRAAQLGRVEQAADRVRQRGAEPGSTSSPARPSRPTTSGSAPAVVDTTGTSHAIASPAGKPKPSYSDGTTATVDSAYARAISSASTRPVKCTTSRRPRRSTSFAVCVRMPRLADHRELERRPRAAQHRERLEQERKALQRRVRGQRRDQPVRPALDPRQRVEDVEVDAVADHAHAVALDPVLALQVARRRLGDRQDTVELARHVLLHGEEAVPAAQAVALEAGRRGAQRDAEVHRHRVVDGRDDRHLRAHAAAAPVRETGCRARRRSGVRAPRARKRRATRREKVSGSGNPPSAVRAYSATLIGSRSSRQRRPAEERRLVPQVEARHLHQADAVGQLRVRRAAPDVDLVAERLELLAQQPDVDPLSARTRVSPVGEQTDAQRFPGQSSTQTWSWRDVGTERRRLPVPAAA